MDNRATSTAGLASGRGSRLFGNVALGVAALVAASGLAAWMTGFDPTGWVHPASANVSSKTTFDDRFGSGSLRNSLTVNYPWRTASRPLRSDFDAEFGHIERQLGGSSGDSQNVQPRSSAPSAEAAIPLPRSRPVEADLQPRNDPQRELPDNRTMFQKLADLVPMRFSLASLTPRDGLFGERKDLAALGYDGVTAVYDITARSVYLPDGTRLEAHSGLGNLMDDPANVHQPNIGATPPNVYDLKPRERPFHGVAALRMTPVGDAETHGRTGLLVHSYLLGPNGDSNGCVSIKDYERFLRAFRNGDVRRLVVVPSLDEVTASRRSTSPS